MKNNLDQKEEYIPGVCNIGKAEVRRRRSSAILSALFFLICICSIQLFAASKLWRLLLFVPATSFMVGMQQWYFKFCVRFGIKGVFNFGDPGKFFSVEQQEYLEKDRAKAIRMIVSSILTGGVITVIYFLLPV